MDGYVYFYDKDYRLPFEGIVPEKGEVALGLMDYVLERKKIWDE
ncbi:hypothetical protein [Mechercharimyces sp. CAU 1602]|nr:hypothetical protein [Mechercharimyces sp. CAU 1602]MCS1352606.1 hypothetical protein [Mechercharimyces sp. CAU 1602]